MILDEDLQQDELDLHYKDSDDCTTPVTHWKNQMCLHMGTATGKAKTAESNKCRGSAQLAGHGWTDYGRFLHMLKPGVLILAPISFPLIVVFPLD